MTAISLNELVIVEWSERQGGFHINRLTDTVVKNIRSYLNRRRVQYATVGVVGSDEDALDLIEKLEAERRARRRKEAAQTDPKIFDAAINPVFPTNAAGDKVILAGSPPARGGVAAASADGVVGEAVETVETRRIEFVIEVPRRPRVSNGGIFTLTRPADMARFGGDAWIAEIDRREAIAALMTADEREFFNKYCSARDE